MDRKKPSIRHLTMVFKDMTNDDALPIFVLIQWLKNVAGIDAFNRLASFRFLRLVAADDIASHPENEFDELVQFSKPEAEEMSKTIFLVKFWMITRESGR